MNEAEQAFYAVRDAVGAHDDPNWEVVLCIDASQYGIGGYLCQRHKRGIVRVITMLGGNFGFRETRSI